MYPFCRGDKKSNDSDSDEEDSEKSRLKGQLEGMITSAVVYMQRIFNPPSPILKAGHPVQCSRQSVVVRHSAVLYLQDHTHIYCACSHSKTVWKEMTS